MTITDKKIQKRIDEIVPKIEAVLKKYPVTKAGLFGSVLRDDFKASGSDIDVLVELDENSNIGLWDYIGIRNRIEESLGRKVDLVQYKGIKPFLKDYILPNEYRFYEA